LLRFHDARGVRLPGRRIPVIDPHHDHSERVVSEIDSMRYSVMIGSIRHEAEWRSRACFGFAGK
jgi:hypothetical protein